VRVILDTNILLSALISPSGPPARLVDAWLDGAFALVSHPLQLDELREVTRREKIRQLISAPLAGRLVNQIALVATMPDALPPVARSPDPRDDFLLALCTAGPADWLVTGDKGDLLALGSHGPARIVTAVEMVGLIRRGR
jgi:putative PIN family toxin of toxin-antitoxin system